MEIYKLLKEYPGHKIGDTLYKSNNTKYYIFDNEPHYKIDGDIIKSSNDFFEKVVLDWEIGEKIYFLDFYGNIQNEEFHPVRHSKLVESYNAFKSKKKANEIKENFRKILEGNVVILSKDDLNYFKQCLISKKYEELKNKFNSYKFL